MKQLWTKYLPVLHELQLNHASLSEKTVSGGDLLHLERILLSSEKTLNDNETLILKSPNLKYINLPRFSYELLKFVNEHAPQLETLKMWETILKNSSYLNDVEYRFQNVKKLHVNSLSIPPVHFQFDRLNEFIIDGSEFRDEWLNFTIQNKNLKRCEILAGLLIERNLNIIAENLGNLEVMTILCKSDVQPATIAKLVRNNDKMKKLKLIVDDSMRPSLQEIFKNEWTFSEKRHSRNLMEYVFEKK